MTPNTIPSPPKPIVSTQDIQMLLDRQSEIAEELYNMEYEHEGEADEAEVQYFASVNLLYLTLGENTPCVMIDPILFKQYTNKFDKYDKTLSRRDVLVKLGKSH